MSPPSSPEPERVPADEVEVVDDPIRRLIDGVRAVDPRARVEVDSSELILRGTVRGGTPESRWKMAAEAIAGAIDDDMRVRREKARELAVRTSIERATERVRALLEGTGLDLD